MSCDSYCMNHGCNRGTGCPAGPNCYGLPGCDDVHCPGHPGAKVARIGRRMPAADPLPRSPWRVHLKDLARSMLLAIVVMLATALALFLFR